MSKTNSDKSGEDAHKLSKRLQVISKAHYAFPNSYRSLRRSVGPKIGFTTVDICAEYSREYSIV